MLHDRDRAFPWPSFQAQLVKRNLHSKIVPGYVFYPFTGAFAAAQRALKTGAFTLGFALQHRDAPLDELDFSGNRAGAVGARSLLRAVRDRRGALRVDLAGCDTSCRDADVFDDLDPEGEWDLELHDP